MSIYRDKRTGRWRFEFDHYVGGRRVRRRTLLPAGYTRAEAEAFDRKEGKALWSIAHGMAAPRATVDQAVACYIRERAPQMKHGNNARREIEQFRPWWSGRAIEELPAICAEYAADQHGALKPATIRNRIAYLRAACRWAWKQHGMADSDPAARVVVRDLRSNSHEAFGYPLTVYEVLDIAEALLARHREGLPRRVVERQRARPLENALVRSLAHELFERFNVQPLDGIACVVNAILELNGDDEIGAREVGKMLPERLKGKKASP